MYYNLGCTQVGKLYVKAKDDFPSSSLVRLKPYSGLILESYVVKVKGNSIIKEQVTPGNNVH